MLRLLGFLADLDLKIHYCSSGRAKEFYREFKRREVGELQRLRGPTFLGFKEVCHALYPDGQSQDFGYYYGN